MAPAEAQNEAWEAHKAAEREAAGGAESALDGVALALPALLRAAKISRRAARIGFDWPDAQAVVPKIAEEIAEIEAELAGAARQAALEEEVGDLLFAAANLARKLSVEPETALRRATAKFERRFRAVEILAKQRGIGRDLDALESVVAAGEGQRKTGSGTAERHSTARYLTNAAAVDASTGRDRLREPHRQMRGLGIVAAAEHLAMLVDPGQRLAVGERHIEPYRARTILQAVIDQTEQSVAPLPGRCR